MSAYAKHRVEFVAALSVFGMLAWLNDRPESDHLRLAFAAIVLVLAAIWLWDGRRSPWRPPLMATAALGALVSVYLTSPDVNVPIFEEFMAPAIGTVFVWLLAWGLIRIVFPGTTARYQALPILLLSCAFSCVLLACSVGLWLKAVDLNALPRNAVATTGAEIAALWEQPWGMRYNGIFAVGRIGDPDKRAETEGDDYLAYYNGPRPIGFSSNSAIKLPSSYTMRMADGAIVEVQGVAQARRTTGWPECGPYVRQRCLRQGDPVVIWADPGALRAFSGSETRSALNATRVIAYGSLEDFRDGYLARAVATARIFGWIALAFLPPALVPALFGYRKYRWLLAHGSDEPSRITVTRT